MPRKPYVPSTLQSLELEALAAVGDDRDVLLHHQLEVAALLRLPVDDERLAAAFGLAARTFAEPLCRRRFLRPYGSADLTCSAPVECSERAERENEGRKNRSAASNHAPRLTALIRAPHPQKATAPRPKKARGRSCFCVACPTAGVPGAKRRSPKAKTPIQ
jgi:hypothetical protein